MASRLYSGITFALLPLPGGMFQIVGIGSGPGHLDELCMATDPKPISKITEQARKLRNLVDDLERMARGRNADG